MALRELSLAVSNLPAAYALPQGQLAALLSAIGSDTLFQAWNAANRAKVSPIAGQDGVAAGAGNVDALTQRFALASNHWGTQESQRIFVRGADFERDAFGRFRTSHPQNLFQINHLADNLAYKAKGFGAGSDAWDSTYASRKLTIPAAATGIRTYATHQHIPYQPGKGQRLKGASIFGAKTPGVLRRFGLRNRRTGERIFWEQDGDRDEYYFVLESYRGAGLVRVLDVPRTTGWLNDFTAIPSFDFEKNILFDLDFQWLSAGRLRAAFDTGMGYPEYVVKQAHTGQVAYPWVQNPNFQIFWELEVTVAQGADTTLHAICASIESEGGQEFVGQNYSHYSAIDGVAISSADTCIFALRPKATYFGMANIGSAILRSVQAYADDDMLVRVVYNPTFTGGKFVSVGGNSIMQYANGIGGSTIPTVTGGEQIDTFFVVGGKGQSSQAFAAEIQARAQAMTMEMDGTSAIGMAVLVTEPTGSTVTKARVSVNWVESP
jgi:hypothetical protein